jgi:hypothetical protein
MIEMTRDFPLITPAEIERFEKTHRLRLPEQYKQFLLAQNGGVPAQRVLISKVTETEGQEFVVRRLLPLSPESKVGFENLESFFQTYKGREPRMPREMLPIASDPFGNLFCIQTRGDGAGRVYFWSHDDEFDEEIEGSTLYSNLRFLANDFDQFINSLQ